MADKDFVVISSPETLGEVASNQAKAIQASSQALQTTAGVNDKLVSFIINLFQAKRICSAQDTPVNDQMNWFCPNYQGQTYCYICHYFGHGIEACPNISKSPSAYCIRCWQTGHGSQNCALTMEQAIRCPFFKINFMYPSDLLRKLLF